MRIVLNRYGVNGWVAVGLLALVVRLGLFLIAAPWSDSYFQTQLEANEDTLSYHNLALKMAGGVPLGEEGLRRTPGYPAYLAMFYFLFGVSFWAPVLFQILLSAASVVITYFIAKDWFGARPALFAGLLYALEPHAIMSSCMLLSDVLFVFLLLLVSYAFLKGLQRRSLLLIFTAGTILGASALVRPIGQYLFVVYVLYILWDVFGKRLFNKAPSADKQSAGISKQLPHLLKAVSVFGLGIALVMSPWLIRNYSQYGHAALTDKGGEHLLYWVAAYTLVARDNRPIREVRAALIEERNNAGYSEHNNPFENAKIQSNIAVKHISNDLLHFTKVQIVGVINTFINLDTKRLGSLLGNEGTKLEHDWYDTSTGFGARLASFMQTKTSAEIGIGTFVFFCLAITYVGALGGVVVALKRGNYSPLVFTLLISGYFCAMIGPIGVARYKLTFMPFYLALGGLLAHQLLDMYSKRVGIQIMQAELIT